MRSLFPLLRCCVIPLEVSLHLASSWFLQEVWSAACSTTHALFFFSLVHQDAGDYFCFLYEGVLWQGLSHPAQHSQHSQVSVWCRYLIVFKQYNFIVIIVDRERKSVSLIFGCLWVLMLWSKTNGLYSSGTLELSLKIWTPGKGISLPFYLRSRSEVFNFFISVGLLISKLSSSLTVFSYPMRPTFLIYSFFQWH